MPKRLRSYKPELEHSYALGVFPTIELLTHRPDALLEVVVCSTWERNEGIGRIMQTCSERSIPVTVSDKTLSRISRRTDCWAAGVFAKWSDELDPAADHVVLVSPSDMGNLGTVMRTMLAHEVRDLATVGPTCDVFDPRVGRSSMGALFQTRVARFESFADYSSRFERGFYCLMSDAPTPLPEVAFSRPFTLIFGNEGEGLPPEYGEVGTSVRIPQSKAVDSLNLAVAVGIALYAATQSSH